MSGMDEWMALAIGNSRLHWALFADGVLAHAWSTAYLKLPQVQALIASQFDFYECGLLATKLPIQSLPAELWIASVVPSQMLLWQDYAHHVPITLAQVPLGQMYPTLGVDRALAVWGAVTTVGCPALVIDGGTALTFTGVDAAKNLVGGAIVPGLGLQLQALHQQTAALPLVDVPSGFLPYWATDTPTAIVSGILHTLQAGIAAFIEAWQMQFPGSAIVFTGGDGERFYQLSQALAATWVNQCHYRPHVLFEGMAAVRANARA
jgi:type III pantothenate kinase